jgi:hypothetical protein
MRPSPASRAVFAGLEFMTIRGLIDGLAERGALDPPTSEMLQLVWSRCPWLAEPQHVPATARHNLDV